MSNLPGNVRVLIVDDHAAVRDTLRQLLEDGGLEVVGEAADGRQGVWLCERLHPQVIVLDISMPLLNGFQAAREIARLSPSTKIIFLTGHQLTEYADQAFRAGGVGFLTKNEAAFGLLTAIKTVMRGMLYYRPESVA